MKIIADTHCHTIASTHAYSSIEEMFRAARSKQLYAIAITDHGKLMPGAPGKWYFENLVVIPRLIDGVIFLRGIEANVCDYDGNLDVEPRALDRLDWIVASMHAATLKPGNIEQCTNAWLGVAKNPRVNVIGHSGDQDFAYDYESVIPQFGHNGKLVEINNNSFRIRKNSIANCKKIAQICKKHGVSVVVNSDAHLSSQIAQSNLALELLKEIDFPEDLIINTNIDRFKQYLKQYTNIFDENNNLTPWGDLKMCNFKNINQSDSNNKNAYFEHYDKIVEFLRNGSYDFKLDEPMLKYTSFKVGGPADIFVVVYDEESLAYLVKELNDYKIPLFLLGKGSNILVSDKGIRGVVIQLKGDFYKAELIDNNIIKCGSGLSLVRLCNFAYENSLSGLEFAFGIPGSAGGAAFMNAGAYGGDMKDVLVLCTHLNRNHKFDGGRLKIETLVGDQLNLSYRRSAYTNTGDIILSLTFQLHKDDKALIKQRMDQFMLQRKTKQPLEYPSAGSVFKRPPGYYAGTLIQECGLKGVTVGGAMVSEKHAGFIVNAAKATCKDVLDLIKLVQETVRNKTGVLLECEVKTIGEL